MILHEGTDRNLAHRSRHDRRRRGVCRPPDLLASGEDRPLPAEAPRRSLQRVLCDLLDSEISAGLQTFAFDSFRVWIGDELNGFEATAEITAKDPACPSLGD